jgi:prepilin peptidase CpaA
MILSLFIASFLALCLLAALIDFETLTIPNWLNGWMAFLFVPAAILAAPGFDVVGWHFLVAAIAFAVTVGLFFLGIIGGGDAKMIPAVMLWVGPAGSMDFILYMTMSGAVLTVAVVIMRVMIPAQVTPGFGLATLKEGKGVPYGVAIAIGAFMAVPASPFLTEFLNQIRVFS